MTENVTAEGVAEALVLEERLDGGVARLTLNRPATRNAQDTDLLYALNAAFDRAAAAFSAMRAARAAAR